MKQINIVELFQSYFKNWKLLLKCGATTAVIGLIIAYSTPRQYRSIVEVVSENNNNNSSSSSISAVAGMMGVNMGTTKEGLTIEVYPKVAKSPLYIKEFYDIPVQFNGQTITFGKYLTQEQKLPWWSYIFRVPNRIIGWIGSLFSSTNGSVTTAMSYNIKQPTQQQATFEYSFSKAVTVVADKKSGIITINVLMQNPEIAAQIADSAFQKIQRFIIDYRTEKSRQDLEANEMLLAQAKENYYRADAEYALAQDRNRNLISQVAETKLERLQNEKQITFSVYQQLANQVEMNKMKVQEQTPIATLIQPARIPLGADSPSKPKYLIGFAFLGVLFGVMKLTNKYLKSQQ